METTCDGCGKSLTKHPSQIAAYKHHFCSADCHDVFRRRQVEVPCAICGKPLTFKASRAAQAKTHTCSPECSSIFRSRVQTERWQSDAPRQATCANCGQIVERKPSAIARAKTVYCSLECRNAGLAGPRPEMQNGQWYPCETCGKLVYRTPAMIQPHTFCSYECSGKGLGRLATGQERSEHLDLACETCGKPLRRQVSRARKNRHAYCSDACRLTAFADALRQENVRREGKPGRKWQESSYLKRQAFFQSPSGHASRRASSDRWRRKPGSPEWTDGQSALPYTPGFTDYLKRRIRARDGNRCRACDTEGTRRNPLMVHHRDCAKTNHNPSNLITLCGSCHIRVHWGRLTLPSEG